MIIITVPVMYVCGTLCTYVSDVSSMIGVMYFGNACGRVERSKILMFVHVLKFLVLIDSTVQSITYYLFTYVLSCADKIIAI